ncbi:uncharacterized protein G2W53_044102 [Senna tora]|uniref:Uncharacterized protein n=1 Tax=Senna tora TaxID=362788 RepID=A0A834SJZ1_9FABA|nr:uncharacterized protein G2W53_044102 [Senna tora]
MDVFIEPPTSPRPRQCPTNADARGFVD